MRQSAIFLRLFLKTGDKNIKLAQTVGILPPKELRRGKLEAYLAGVRDCYEAMIFRVIYPRMGPIAKPTTTTPRTVFSFQNETTTSTNKIAK